MTRGVQIAQGRRHTSLNYFEGRGREANHKGFNKYKKYLKKQCKYSNKQCYYVYLEEWLKRVSNTLHGQRLGLMKNANTIETKVLYL